MAQRPRWNRAFLGSADQQALPNMKLIDRIRMTPGVRVAGIVLLHRYFPRQRLHQSKTCDHSGWSFRQARVHQVQSAWGKKKLRLENCATGRCQFFLVCTRCSVLDIFGNSKLAKKTFRNCLGQLWSLGESGEASSSNPPFLQTVPCCSLGCLRPTKMWKTSPWTKCKMSGKPKLKSGRERSLFRAPALGTLRGPATSLCEVWHLTSSIPSEVAESPRSGDN